MGAGSFGAGIQLGYPGNGLSFNYFISQSASIQVNPLIRIGDNWTGLGGRVDLLWWQKPITRFDFADLMWYFGPGVNAFLFSWSGKGDNDGYFGLGAELPVGIGLRFTGAPVDLNLEGVPILSILGNGGVNIDFDIAGLLNVRYYF